MNKLTIMFLIWIVFVVGAYIIVKYTSVKPPSPKEGGDETEPPNDTKPTEPEEPVPTQPHMSPSIFGALIS